MGSSLDTYTGSAHAQTQTLRTNAGAQTPHAPHIDGVVISDYSTKGFTAQLPNSPNKLAVTTLQTSDGSTLYQMHYDNHKTGADRITLDGTTTHLKDLSDVLHGLEHAPTPDASTAPDKLLHVKSSPITPQTRQQMEIRTPAAFIGVRG